MSCRKYEGLCWVLYDTLEYPVLKEEIVADANMEK